jgi:outer membrane protein
MRKHATLIILALALPAAQAQDILTTYEQALQRDPTIHQAEYVRNAALESKPQSVAQLLPTLSVAANLNRSYVLTKTASQTQNTLAGGAFVNFWNSAPNLTLSQPIYNHALWVQLSQADNTVAQAEATYEAAQQNLIVRTTTAYYNILYAQDSLEFTRMQRESIGRQLEQSKARFDVGLIAITDVNAAQAGYDLASANQLKAENDLNNACEAMRAIVGEFNCKIAGLAEDIPLKPPEPADMEQWNQRAQENNLLIIAAQNQAELAKKNIDLQFAGHLPTLNLVGTAGFTDNNRPNGVRTEFQTISMQLSLPLFQGGMVNSLTRQAREQFQAAQENLDVQRRAANLQVKTSFRGVTTSISQVTAYQSAVASAQSALEATEAGFEVGTRTMIDVLLVQSNLYQAKRDWAQARYGYITNSIALKQAAGILMREDVELVNRWLSKN